MKIILFVYSAPELYPPIINAANILAEKGHIVYLLGFKLSHTSKIKIDDRVKVKNFGNLQIGYIGIIQYFFVFIKLLLFALKNRPDWIISYDAYASGPSCLIAKTINRPWIYYQHDYWDDPKGIWQNFLHKIETVSARNSYCLCFPQKERLEIFRNKINAKNKLSVIVHNGPRKGWIENKTAPHPLIIKLKNQFEYILIYQGGWSNIFKLDIFIRTIPISKSKFALLFLGKDHEKGYRNQLIELSKSLNVSDRVFFSSEYISYDKIKSLTNYCTIGLAIPCEDTDNAPVNNRFLAGASNKLGEYLACGLVILTTDSKSNRNFFDKYDTAIYFNSKDIYSLAEKIDFLTSHKTYLNKLSLNNKQIFDEYLNFDIQFEKLYNVISRNEAN